MTTKRRGNGEGSVTHCKDGRWSARYYVVLPSGTKKRQSVYGKTQTEALQKMRQEQSLAAQGNPIVRDGSTVEGYLQYWIRNIAPMKVRASTVETYAGTLRKHVISQIGNIRLSSLTAVKVQNMISDHLSNGGSARVAQVVRNTLSSALQSAVQQGQVSQNVARLVQLPKYDRKEKTIWTKEQVLEFKSVIENSDLYPIYEMLFTYGMRRGEVLGLRWKNINFESNAINISQQYTRIGKEWRICELKTNSSKRSLRLLPHIREMLLGLKFSGNVEDFIFTVDDKLIPPDRVSKTFKRIIAKTSLPKITLHDARHIVATMMKDANVPIKDAQTILGHSSAQTTMDHYQHSTLENQTQAFESMMGFMTNDTRTSLVS